MFISYAQNFEDVMLHRALKGVKKGFYIDVGANDPIIDSVTKAFYEMGWRGINIEPVVESYDKLQKDRPEDINLQLAVGARNGQTILFEVVGTGLSTIDEAIAKQHAQINGYELREYKVNVSNLTEICEKFPQADIHFLKIDVEGSEESVLQGFDINKVRPWIVLIESTLPNSQIENYRNWEHYLTERRYHYVYFDGLNRYYVADEHNNLDTAFIVPPNFFDSFKRANECWLENHSQSLQEELDAAKYDAVQLKNTVDQIEAVLYDTQRQRHQVDVQLQTLQVEVVSRDEKLQEKEATLQELLLAMAENQARLHEAGAALTVYRQQVDLLDAELSERKTENAAITSALQETKGHCHQAEAQIAMLQIEVDRRDELIREKEDLRQELLRAQANNEAWLQETKAVLKDYRQKTDLLHVELSESKAEKVSIVSALQETKGHCHQLEARLTILQAELGKRDELIREKEALRQELLRAQTNNEAKLQETMDVLANYERKSYELQSSLAVSVKRSWELESTLQGADQKYQELHTQLQRREAEILQREDQLRGIQEAFSRLNGEYNAAKQLINNLYQTNHEWWAIADKYNNDLHALLNSKSWRYTQPLRKFKQSLFFSLMQFNAGFVRLSRYAVSWLIIRIMIFVQKRPAIKHFGIDFLSRFPGIDRKLRTFALAHGLVVSMERFQTKTTLPEQISLETIITSAGTNVTADLSHMSPRARRIYVDLVSAMTRHQAEKS